MPQSQTISIFDGLYRLHRLVWCLVWGMSFVISLGIISLNGSQRDGSQQFGAAVTTGETITFSRLWFLFNLQKFG